MSQETTPPRLFTLQTHETYGFYTGVRSDGTQVLTGGFHGGMVAYFFDALGALCGGARQPWRHASSVDPHTQILRRLPPALEEENEQQFAKWLEQLHLEPGPIRVQAFGDDEYGTGIEALPSFLSEIDDLFPEQREQNKRMRDRWIEQGSFVFYWDNDFHMHADGTVASS